MKKSLGTAAPEEAWLGGLSFSLALTPHSPWSFPPHSFHTAFQSLSLLQERSPIKALVLFNSLAAFVPIPLLINSLIFLSFNPPWPLKCTLSLSPTAPTFQAKENPVGAFSVQRSCWKTTRRSSPVLLSRHFMKTFSRVFFALVRNEHWIASNKVQK